jgi:hypothetical protein
VKNEPTVHAGAPSDEPAASSSHSATDAPLVAVSAITDRHLISLPDPSADGLEGQIGQANLRRHADALERLETRLPVRVLHPANNPSLECPEVFDVSLQVEADDLWDAMTTIAHHDDLRPGRIAFGLSAAEEGVDDQLAFAATYGIHRPNLGAVAVKAQRGAAVVIHGIEWQVGALYDLVADLETAGGRPCSASVVILMGRAVHEELEKRSVDVLLTPVGGAVVAAGTVEVAPGRAIIAGSGDTVSFSAAGDECVLLVRVELPVADPWVDVLAAAATARFHPLLRADLPTSFERPIESYGGTLYDDFSKFAAEVDNALGPKAMDHAAAFARASLPPRASRDVGLLTSLAFRSNPTGEVRCPAHTGVMLTQVEDASHFAVGGGIFTLPDGAAEQVAPLLDGRPVPVADVLDRLASAGLDETDSRRALIELVQVELLEPVP